MTEFIEIQNNSDIGQWQPFVGEETNELLRSKGFVEPDRTLSAAGEKILDEAYRTMQVCGNPDKKQNRETGIVIGYVQSGKTLSFTTLTALARDNNYQIVIVMAGTKTNLFNQSTERLKKDLRLETRYDRKWVLMQNPSRIEDRETLETTLAQWADPTFPSDRRRTVLITVMKNGSRLRKLTSLLKDLQLKRVPTLIIDDEGDQASLNTRARQAAIENLRIENLTETQVSTIYRRITGLRAVFPHHTFLQYTATPQANLFINIMDRLSPNFIKLLTPGDEYTGAIQFFRQNQHLIQEIPPSDISTTNNSLLTPPESLIRALKIFFLGVVAGELSKDQRNRSMLIHPSRLQGDQNTFYRWVNNIRDSWQRLLTGNDADEKAHLLDEFREAFDDLRATVPNLPLFEQLTDHNLVHAIQYTPILEVNTRRGATPQINWQDSYSWILVGGESMDRGFTVEGLTVTYMPRNVGVGNVDTIQQRARFFGYKQNYIGYCRVFLDQITIQAYNSIIEHEEDVRERLEDFNVNNRHLDDWAREAVLDQMLNLTRTNVIYDNLNRDRFGRNWFEIIAPHDTEHLIETNRIAMLDFLKQKIDSFSEDVGHADRTQEQKHLVARLQMKECLELLLNKLKFTWDSDSAAYSSLRGILKLYLDDNPDEHCLIYLMSARSLTDWSVRSRRLDKQERIQELFQGKNPRTGPVIYPGDREIKNDGLVCIQIHRLHITDSKGNDIADEDGNVKYHDVPTVAVWIPDHIGKDVIRQA